MNDIARWGVALCGLILASAGLGVFDANAAEPAREPLRVVILHGTHMLLPGSLVQEKVVREVLIAGASRPVEFHSETLNVASFNPRSETLFVGLLNEKFRGQKPDLIMAAQAPALGFILRRRAQLWPDVPVVCFGMSGIGPDSRLPWGVTGVGTPVDPAGTVNLARKLQPELSGIFVIVGSSPIDRAWIPFLRDSLRPLENDLSITWLTNRTLTGLGGEVRSLPPHSMVLYATMFRDAAGVAMVPRDACVELSKVSSVPIYGLYDSLIGHGILGGSMSMVEENSRRAAQVGLRILGGEKPEAIPPIQWPPVNFVVDSRELRRWGISESRVPPGGRLLFRQPGYWARHRGVILAAAGIALAQFALIVALWINWAKRRRSERDLDSQLRFERLVSDLSAMFINVPLESVDREVMRALEIVRSAMDLDHCRLFRVGAGENVIEVEHHAETPGLTPMPGRIERSTLPLAFELLTQGRTVSFENTLRDLPADAAAERAFVAQHKLQSMLIIPVRITRESTQGLCFHTTRHTQAWPKTLTSRLHLLGEILISALAEKQAALALRASEERYREVVESQAEMVCRYLPDTTLTFVNEAYCRCFCRPRSTLVGTRLLDLISEAAHGPMLEHVATAARTLAAATLEHEVRLPDGTMAWHHWTTHAVVGPGGQVVEFQAIGRDISDRKRAEAANRSLARASRLALMGELTATIGHEVNQPLTAILSNAEAAQLLLNSAAPPLKEVRMILADIRSDSLRAGSVIQHVRSLLREGKAEAQLLDLNEIASDVMRFVETDALHRGVRLQTRLAHQLPFVLGDRVHLQQALLNLIVNGMDAMSDTSEADRRLVVSTSNGDGTVQLSVSDHGRGIPPERLTQVFDSFFTTKKDGMGLGLSIARTIIHAHNGKIWGENNAGGGMTFRFALPVGDNNGQKTRVE